mmetsp:Transcript_3670/g.3826  ORF Transcript_3670/g.3826 Transcript_3670/m.3826 type:complete len:108 (-) Transcript_3670:485-808(-)
MIEEDEVVPTSSEVEDDDEASLTIKRKREEKEAEDRKSRGNYRCSKCNVPKKGHLCPYQPRYRRRDQAMEGTSNNVETQCEMDEGMTVRTLILETQGQLESYLPPGK